LYVHRTAGVPPADVNAPVRDSLAPLKPRSVRANTSAALPDISRARRAPFSLRAASASSLIASAVVASSSSGN
jgi:hypothetical protein